MLKKIKMEEIDKTRVPFVTKSDQTIKIYNPNEQPFGPLSNNYRHVLSVGKKQWSTPTNYILSNMLITPIYRLAIQNAKITGNAYKTNINDHVTQIIAQEEIRMGKPATPQQIEQYRKHVIQTISTQRMDIYQVYEYYLGAEHINNLRRAVELAYTSKLETYPDLVNALLNTGNSPIVYISTNMFLGATQNGVGNNLIGVTLMQLRYRLQLKKEREREKERERDLEENVIVIYQAYNILNQLLMNDNDLSEYIGNSARQIIEKNDATDIPDDRRKIILQLFNRGHYPLFKKELEQPGYLVMAMRRDNLQRIRERRKQKRDDIIVQLYSDYILAQKYPDKTPEQIRALGTKLLTTSPSIEAYNILKSQIVDLYTTGQLSPELTQRIKQEIDEEKNVESHESHESDESHKSHESDESHESTSDSSSSSDGNPNPLKQLLKSDEKDYKNQLIRRIQRYTGRASKKYKKYSVEELKQKLSEYEGVDAVKSPKSDAGEWIVRVMHPHGYPRKEIIGNFAIKPDESVLAKMVKKYNKRNKRQIKNTQLAVVWQPKHVSEEEVEKIEIEKPTGFVKAHGDVVYLYPQIDKNEPGLEPFSPIFEQEITVENLTFPSVSFFITAMLLTHTGVMMKKYNDTYAKPMNDRVDYNVCNTYTRGRSLEDARALIIGKNIHQATQLYENEKLRTFQQLLFIFTNIILDEKFKDTYFKNLLLLTGYAQLIWNDPHDTYLGIGTKEHPGQNIVGKKWESLRTYYRPKFNVPNLLQTDEQIRDKFVELCAVMFQDKFLKTWINMRVNDMCSTVYRVKHYLWKVAQLDETIDEKFVRSVLDTVYQPCSMVVLGSDSIDVLAPHEFVRMVKVCKGATPKFTQNFKKEVNILREKMDREKRLFYGRPIVDKTTELLPLEKFLEKQRKQMAEFQAQNPDDDELEEFKNKLEQEYLLYEEEFKQLQKPVERKPEFSEIQRREWEEFFEKLTEPELSYEEINKQIAKLRKKHDNALKSEKSAMKIIEMKQKHKNEMNRLIRNLYAPKYNNEEINERITDFTKRQDAELKRRYHGLSDKDKTEEEIAEHRKILIEYQEQILRLTKQYNDELADYNYTINDIVQVYWKRIAVMIFFIMRSLKTDSINEIRRMIVTSELLNSRQHTCEDTNIDIQNNMDNCISSGLFNLLIGINNFKNIYSGNIPFNTPDILLAGSIILDRDLSDVNIEDAQPEVVEMVEDELDIQSFDDDMVIEDESDIVEYGDEEDRDYDPEQFLFGFDKRTGPIADIERVNALLRSVNNSSQDMTELSKYFIGMINTIKTYKLPQKIKTNRINFFATLR